jgi:DNA repair exonuclease SbcCD ATPase subunit
MIEEILGFDHKSFAQIVYQSNASSLEFLTAPDTARKKFLIEILNLSKYTRAAEIFKEVTTELAKDIATANSKVSTVSSWLNKYESTDLSIKPIIEVPEMDTKLYSETLTLSQQLDSLESTNKKIQQNNTYKQLQSKINLLPIPDRPKADIQFINEKTKVLNNETIELSKTIKDSKTFIQKMEKLEGNCPTCLQHINKEKIDELIYEQVTIQKTTNIQLEKLTVAISELNAESSVYSAEKMAWEQAQKSQEEWEKYHRLIDTELQNELLDLSLIHI